MSVRGVSKIVVGVDDQQRAKHFWTELLGFSVAIDEPYGDSGERWLEVTTPDGETTLVLSPSPEDKRRWEVGGERPNTNFFFYADDLVSTYEELSAKGVEFPAKPSRQPWGWWSMFADPDGNRFPLVQR
ncbi:VOC family protein [Amycolatopsis albispora]|uniref:VOC family protein n=1 Tax=Amycolatopsis albispora TaxID=1804986 RepID=UPI000DE32E77|nr:VOC family protein [Amycolatopsis albispora]